MALSHFIKVYVIPVIVLGLLLFFLWKPGGEKEPPASFPEEAISSYPLRIKGFSSSTYDDNRLIARIEADEFLVKQRRFFVFNIRPFKEAAFTNARLELHLYKKMPPGADIFSSAGDILSLDKKGRSNLKGIGLITRGVVNGFTLEVYREDKPLLVVKAKKAYIDFKKKRTKLSGVRIEDVLSGKIIKSGSVIWKHKENVFDIPGEYIALTPKGTARGKGIKVNFDFDVSLLKSER